MDPEIAEIPKQIVLGICLDCDKTQPTTPVHARCAVCGSASVIRKGAVKELARQLKIRKERARELEKDRARRARREMKGGK